MNDWPSGMLVKPIVDWPGEPTRPGARTWAPFRAGWRQTLELLDRELRLIAATSRVLQVDIPERDFRIDGFPRANARQNGPGVILTFTASVAGDLSYPCDTYTDWQDNLRAVALALEALRKVDRYRPGKRTLSAMAATYGLRLDDAHNAQADALTAARIAWKMADRHQQLQIDLIALHEKQVAWRYEQCVSLQDYFRRTTDPAAVVNTDWPIQALPFGWDRDQVDQPEPVGATR